MFILSVFKPKILALLLAVIMLVAGGWYLLGQSNEDTKCMSVKLTVVIEEVNDTTDEVTAAYMANISGAPASGLEMLTSVGDAPIRSSNFEPLQMDEGGWGGNGQSNTNPVVGVTTGSHYHVYINAYITARVTNTDLFVTGPQKHNSGITDVVYDDWVHVEGKVGTVVPSHSGTWETLKTQSLTGLGGSTSVGWHPGLKNNVQIRADQYATTGTYFDQYQDSTGWHPIKGDTINGMQFKVTALSYVKAQTGEVVESGAGQYIVTLNTIGSATMLSLDTVSDEFEDTYNYSL